MKMKGNDSIYQNFIKGKDSRSGGVGLPAETELKRWKHIMWNSLDFKGFFLGEGDGWVFGQGELSNKLQPVVLFSLNLSKVVVDAVAFCASCPLTLQK